MSNTGLYQGQHNAYIPALPHRSPCVSGRGPGQAGVVPLSLHTRPAVPLPASSARRPAIFTGNSGNHLHASAFLYPGGSERVNSCVAKVDRDFGVETI